MALSRYWRIAGIITAPGSALELTQALLLVGGIAATAALSCPFAPSSGSIATLQNSGSSAVVRWDNSAVIQSGFALVWDLGASPAAAVTLEMRSANSVATYPTSLLVQSSDDGQYWVTQQVYSQLLYPGALSTSALSIAAVSDPNAAAVTLLLDASTGVIADNATTPKSLTLAGAAGASPVQSKFNNQTLGLIGASAHVSVPYSTDFNFAAGDFTIETWLYKKADCPLSSRLWNPDADAFTNVSLSINASGALEAFLSVSGASWAYSFTSIAALSNNRWYHIALVRSGGNLFAFIDGAKTTLSAALGTAVLYNQTAYPFVVGGQTSVARRFFGHLDQFRISKGLARYTAAFAVPSSPFVSNGTLAIDTSAKAYPTQVLPSVQQPGAEDVGGFAKQILPVCASADTQDGGLYKVVGTVYQKNAPADLPVHRRVVLFDERSSRPIRETWSDPVSGAYSFTGIAGDRKYTAVAYDHSGAFRAVIADGQTAELMT
jgi:hypothetical protein